MHIETPRMLIRNFIPEDANDLYEILGDAETMEYSEPPYDMDKTKLYCRMWATRDSRRTSRTGQRRITSVSGTAGSCCMVSFMERSFLR